MPLLEHDPDEAMPSSLLAMAKEMRLEPHGRTRLVAGRQPDTL